MPSHGVLTSTVGAERLANEEAKRGEGRVDSIAVRDYFLIDDSADDFA